MGAEHEIVIVGAGPAGLSAAIRAAEGGASVTLLDEQALPGGQIYRQPPALFRVTDPHRMGPDFLEGKKLLQRFERTRERIAYRPGCLVWGVFNGRELALFENGRSSQLVGKTVIFAPGAFERAVPFPGWTLPGVYTAGGLQISLKSQRVLPARRFLISGTGPLLLVLANQLASSGGEVSALLEISALRSAGLHLPRLLRHWGFLSRGLRLHRGLKKHGIPYRERETIIEARGDGRVEEAVVARVNAAWQPLPGSERTIPVDAVAVGYGFVSNTELTRLAGCLHEFRADLGSWAPIRNEGLETTVPGVFAAGDGAGVAGAPTALAEGRLAALSALERLGYPVDRIEQKSLLRELAKLNRFRAVMDRISTPRPGWVELMTPDTVVCRCEDVTQATIEKALDEGFHTLDGIKRRCRAGMGFCQGRICSPAVAALAARREGASLAGAGWLNPRPPLQPLPLGAFSDIPANGEEDSPDTPSPDVASGG